MKDKLSLIYRFIIIICCLIGLILNFKLIGSHAILYFTIQSNLLVLIFYLIAVPLQLTNKLNKTDKYHIFKGMMIMAITITLFVFWGLIARKDLGVYDGHLLECNFVHIITPLLVMFDYVIFEERGNLKWYYPFIWSLTLVAYSVFDLIYTAFGGTFENGSKAPYFYMDAAEIGNKGVMFYCLMIYLGFVLYGVIIQKLDNLVKKTLDKQNKIC